MYSFFFIHLYKYTVKCGLKVKIRIACRAKILTTKFQTEKPIKVIFIIITLY